MTRIRILVGLLVTAALIGIAGAPSSAALGTCALDSNPGNPGGGTGCVRGPSSDCWAYYVVWENSDGTGYTGVGCNNPSDLEYLAVYQA